MTTAMQAREMRHLGKYWWLWLVAGIIWVIVAMVILQMDSVSVRTVGVLIGVFLIVGGIQYFVLGSLAEGWKWLYYVFGIFLLVGGVFAVVNPVDAFGAVADMAGFLFALVGIIWIIEAFAMQQSNPVWWLGLVAGILMLVMGFWVGGQFFFDKAYTVLVATGIWLLMKGITDVVMAFQIRNLGSLSASV